MNQDPYKEYIIQGEPSADYKRYIWSTAIGLQAVDGLKPSAVLLEIASQNIDGYISLEDAQNKIDSYYESLVEREGDARTEEADKVSARIANVLSEKAFSFSESEYIAIHKKLFSGIYKHAGKIRDYNITKKEWVLDGDTVLYASATDLKRTLEYDFLREKEFDYRGCTNETIISHLASFISGLWQIHPFGEGNTRTIAVFFIKYLRSLGYEVTNDSFVANSWYFRNALVRANYTNITKGIYETTSFLEKFIRNLLLGEKNELKNRHLHIHSHIFAKKMPIGELKEDMSLGNLDIDTKKVAIDEENVAIGEEKVAIEGLKLKKQTKTNIKKLYERYGNEEVFGRGAIAMYCEISYTAAGNLIAKLRANDIITEVKGHGKGKYVFK